MNNLQDDGWNLSDLKYIELPPNEAERYRLEPDDILFNRTNSKELVGKCAVFREEGHWVFASYLIRISLDQTKASPDFVALFLNTRAGRAQIDRLSRQIIGMSNINAQEIRELQIPLPPLDIQSELVTHMQAAHESRRAKLAEADNLLMGIDSFLLNFLNLTPTSFTRSTSFAVSVREVRKNNRLNPDYFHPERINAISLMENSLLPVKRLAEIVRFARDSVTSGNSEALYLGLAGVASHTGELTEVDSNDVEGQAFMYQKNDVLFARLRPYLNKVYYAESDGICSTEFHVLRVHSVEGVLPDYLAIVLRSPLILTQTKHMMTGNTHPRLANDDVVNLVIPIPDLNIQREIVSEFLRRRTEARRLRAEADAEWAAAKEEFEHQLLGTIS